MTGEHIRLQAPTAMRNRPVPPNAALFAVDRGTSGTPSGERIPALRLAEKDEKYATGQLRKRVGQYDQLPK